VRSAVERAGVGGVCTNLPLKVPSLTVSPLAVGPVHVEPSHPLGGVVVDVGIVDVGTVVVVVVVSKICAPDGDDQIAPASAIARPVISALPSADAACLFVRPAGAVMLRVGRASGW
jgi:hypothetical protein